MKVLLDTHFLLWLVYESAKVRRFPWLDRYRPWLISPVSLLEIQYLVELGRIDVEQPGFVRAILDDPRFSLDEPGYLALIERAIPVTWTRDVFDRLLVAHSLLRAVPLCTVDREIRTHHVLLPLELATV